MRDGSRRDHRPEFSHGNTDAVFHVVLETALTIPEPFKGPKTLQIEAAEELLPAAHISST